MDGTGAPQRWGGGRPVSRRLRPPRRERAHGRPSVRGLLLLSIAAGLLAAAGSAGGSTGTTGSTRATAHGVAGAAAAACLAHVAVPTRVYYAGDCTGHDEPELDPVSSARHSALDVTWHVALPADGTSNGDERRPNVLVRRHRRRFEPGASSASEGFLELRSTPTRASRPARRGRLLRAPRGRHVHRVLARVVARAARGRHREPAAFNGMLGERRPAPARSSCTAATSWTSTSGRRRCSDAYREQVADETTGRRRRARPRQPDRRSADAAVRHQRDRQRARLGHVWDTPMAFVYEIGHADELRRASRRVLHPRPGVLRVVQPRRTGPASSRCGSSTSTFGDGSHPQHWAAVSDTGGKAEVLGKSFVGPTTCAGYGGPNCIYPWFSWDGQAFNYGVDYPNTVDNLGGAAQFAPPLPARRRSLPRADVSATRSCARRSIRARGVDSDVVHLSRRSRPHGAAPESNRASVGLPRLTGFEGRLGHQARPLQAGHSSRGRITHGASGGACAHLPAGWSRRLRRTARAAVGPLGVRPRAHRGRQRA